MDVDPGLALTASLQQNADSQLQKESSVDVDPRLALTASLQQNADSQLQKESSVELDPGLASDEQNKAMGTTGTVTKTETCEIATENNTMSKTSDTCVPAADPSKESIKSDIVKPVRNFQPSPDIFHRSCVCNPSLDPESVPVSHKFTVASYNILAECHRKRGDYSYTEEKYLEQEYRHQLLMKELQYLDADIVCLQEVNPEYYNTHLQPSLHRQGYAGTFIKRKQEHFDEGAATFVKSCSFDVESWEGLSLSEHTKMDISDLVVSHDIKESLLKYVDRSDVVNICRVRCKKTSKMLTIGNVHLVWDDYLWPDIKCLQVATAVRELVTRAGSDTCPHILCGDFNSGPSSAVYQLALDGYLSDLNIQTLQAVENLEHQSASDSVPPCRPRSLMNYLSKCFFHTSTNMASTYHTCQGREPEVTCYDRESWGCLDYILYGKDGLQVLGVLQVTDRESLEASNGLPNQHFPSDHLSLRAAFQFQ